ncbi:hypothetical protein ACFSQJ_08600 [Croceitalea marina]|uniref:Uncharacterized protein n=1 Tax=Croceitalea marina TaxID=1775166 RepID=A0ABW5MXW2_9FLAO
MDIKKIFGTVLTLAGIGGLIYTAILYGNGSENTRAMVIYGILGALFFFSGIGLIRNTSKSS